MLEALRGDRTVQEVAARNEVHPNQVSTWKRQAVDGLQEKYAEGRGSGRKEHEATVRDLRAKIGELTVERDFFCAGSSAGAASGRMGLPGGPSRASPTRHRSSWVRELTSRRAGPCGSRRPAR